MLKKYAVTLSVLFSLVTICQMAISEEDPDDLAWRTYSSMELSLTNASVDLGRLLSIRDDIEVEIRGNNEDMSENLKDAIAAFVPGPGQPAGDPASALVAFAKQVKDTTDAIKLAAAHSDCQSSMQSQYDLVNTRIGEADRLYKVYQNDHGGQAPKVIRSNLVLNVSFKCPKCPNTFDTASYGGQALSSSQTEHKETCDEKHGTSGETNVVWWECLSDTCPRAEEHWRLCPGTCNDKFAPKKKFNPLYGTDSSYSASYPPFSYVDNFPHEVKCQKKVWAGPLNPFKTCYGKYETVYYTCEHSTCPNSSNHHNGGDSYYSEPPSGSPSENGGNGGDNGDGNQGNGNGNGAPSPNGGSGNGGNGNQGNGNGNGNNGDGNGNNGDGAPVANGGCTTPPTLVNCYRRGTAGGYERCYAKVSNANEHQVTCPGCNEQYWTCNSTQSDEHRERTCTNDRLPGGNYCYGTWRRCGFTAERVEGNPIFSTASPKCPTDPNGIRHCAE